MVHAAAAAAAASSSSFPSSSSSAFSWRPRGGVPTGVGRLCCVVGTVAAALSILSRTSWWRASFQHSGGDILFPGNERELTLFDGKWGEKYQDRKRNSNKTTTGAGAAVVLQEVVVEEEAVTAARRQSILHLARAVRQEVEPVTYDWSASESGSADTDVAFSFYCAKELLSESKAELIAAFEAYNGTGAATANTAATEEEEEGQRRTNESLVVLLDAIANHMDLKIEAESLRVRLQALQEGGGVKGEQKKKGPTAWAPRQSTAAQSGWPPLKSAAMTQDRGDYGQGLTDMMMADGDDDDANWEDDDVWEATAEEEEERRWWEQLNPNTGDDEYDWMDDDEDGDDYFWPDNGGGGAAAAGGGDGAGMVLQNSDAEEDWEDDDDGDGIDEDIALERELERRLQELAEALGVSSEKVSAVTLLFNSQKEAAKKNTKKSVENGKENSARLQEMLDSRVSEEDAALDDEDSWVDVDEEDGDE